MKRILLAIAFAALPSLAMAKSFAIPPSAPIATVEIPDSWKASELETGAEATSADDEVYVSLETSKLGDFAAITDVWTQYLVKKGVTLDEASKAQSNLNVNGMTGLQTDWTGTDKDGPVKVSLILLKPPGDGVVVLTYWASPEGEAKNANEIVALAKSITPAK